MNRFRDSIFFGLQRFSRVCLDSRLERAEASQLEPLWLALPLPSTRKCCCVHLLAVALR